MQTALALKHAGCRVAVLSAEAVDGTNMYTRALRAAGIPLYGPQPRLLALVDLAERGAQLCVLPLRVTMTPVIALARGLGLRAAWREAGQGFGWRVDWLTARVRDAVVAGITKAVARRFGPDVVQITGPWSRVLLSWAAASDYCFVYCESEEPQYRGETWQWLTGLLRRADAIIASSVPLARQLAARFGPFPVSVSIVPHAARAPLSASALHDHERVGPDVTVGSLGRLDSKKGHRYLVAAMQHVVREEPAIRLLLGGDGAETERLKQQVSSSGLDHHVMLLGVVPRDELTSFMAELDIFVMPSLQEGFGIALVEAMAHGKAVIASNVGGMAATVDHGVNGLLVPPADSRALAEAILLLVRDGGLRRRLGEQARRDYEERYAPSVVIEKLLDVYRHALARRAGGCRAVSTPREPDAAWSAGGEMMP